MAKSWFNAKSRGEKSADISIFSDIGGFGVSAQDFKSALDALGDVDKLRLTISSNGGDVSVGFTIFNMLASHPAEKTVVVQGLAASMASVVAMAASPGKLFMPSNSMLMIHNPWGGVVGGSEEIISIGEALADMRTMILNTYTDRTLLDPEDVQGMMDRETWLSAAKAVKLGFADKVVKPMNIAASIDISRFNRVPRSFARIITKETPMAKGKNGGAADDDFEAETPEVTKTAKEIREEILAQHKEIRSLCALAGKPELADGFIAEDKSPADVLAALDAAREEDSKKGKGGKGKDGKPGSGAAEVSARHNPNAADPNAAKALDPTSIYAKWNASGRKSAA